MMKVISDMNVRYENELQLCSPSCRHFYYNNPARDYVHHR